ncbi:TIGR04282 family arsenosugar biosynthesis glycosyltransferase [Pedobacter sp. SYSU D00535]|uniref:TIGR04282 family arsenosugar biosynthesis glycosyltransferase n=1 Tax=Pedobacter sp. SYSU D00535 TaxID=2810308 RepID=UPI001A97CC66|nr:TIGR04282 family arsenosugar biosynthesis glycosyltransferase [Pedobacter sp. SYSU D00535]
MAVQRVLAPAAEEQRPDMENALIIFVKNLQMGKVKTRLAATVGEEKAYAIYSYLLKYTYRTAERVNADKYVFYSDFIPEQDLHRFSSQLQSGQDLGERMKNAFRQILDAGYKKAVIIGSDSLEITSKIVDQAFSALEESEVVIGPATDGGYYLLGMKFLHEELFEDIPWSSADVLKKTMRAVKLNGHTHTLLTELSDIDEEQDWLRFAANVEL